MKDLTGYLKKILLISSILFCFLLFPQELFAQDFTVYADYEHSWDGSTLDSTIYLTMTTKGSPVVVTYYTITIPDDQIEPEVYLINRKTNLIPTIHKKDSITNLVIDLEKTPIYKEKPIKLRISFKKSQKGDRITLLSSVKDTISRNFTFTYPSSLGEVSWSSAPITKVTSKGNLTEIKTASPNSNTVEITFGERICYKYTISKDLINMGEEMIISEVTLPLNNNYQYISVNHIEPIPDNSFRDIDGNYILQYQIAPQSDISLTVEGDIIMSRMPNLREQELEIEKHSLWKINDQSLIRHINRNLQEYGLNITEEFSDVNNLESSNEKELLYKAIYQYVIENLEPNKLTVGSLTGAQRLGGQEVLLKQSVSTSEQYTDSIVSLYRYYKIPARFVIGYVTDISNYHSEGMYHYWAEYLDEDENQWMVVDPFLEDLSKTSLWNRDMKDHIALIYRYFDPNTPKLPFYSQDDLVIEVNESEGTVKTNFQPSLVFQPYNISDPYLIGSLDIINTGTTILDTFQIIESNLNLSSYIDYIENNRRTFVLPGQSHSIRLNIPTENIENNISAVISASSGTQATEEKEITKEIEIIKDYKDLDILTKLLSLLLFLVVGASVYFISKKVRGNG